MSVYAVVKRNHNKRIKGYRYKIVIDGKIYTNSSKVDQTYFKTKQEALIAETKRREEIKHPSLQQITIDTVFLDLVNQRLDYVQGYYSKSYYKSYKCMASFWIDNWGDKKVNEINASDIQTFIIKLSDNISEWTANYHLRCLKALFNTKKWSPDLKIGNPAENIKPIPPKDKKKKYIPSLEDVMLVMKAADQKEKDYLLMFQDTWGRMSEINRLAWDDIHLAMETTEEPWNKSYLTLFTNKTGGKGIEPRNIPTTKRVYEMLLRRYEKRDKNNPWVFSNPRTGEPYKERKRLMKSLCKRADVKYFRYHALRHFGASMADAAQVGIGNIQRLMGHKNRKTTEGYLQGVSEAERQAMKIYESFTTIDTKLTQT
ncbi:MAG: tyrosine-type recombinase/integrase [bacterium]